jgi:hypothetical protein
VPLVLLALLLLGGAFAHSGVSASEQAPSPTVDVATERPTFTPVTPSTTPRATAPPMATPEPAVAPALTATSVPTISLAISKTLLGSDVVQVGQQLTFTVRITNTGSLVVTDLPLVDEYETSILQPLTERASPPPTDTQPGVLRWADLTEQFGDLAPSDSLTVTVVFRALRIDDEVINRVRVESGLGSGGEGGGSYGDEASGAVEGGRVIVEKGLVESFVRLDTPVISFTLSLRNDGYADIVRAPFVDTYDPALLSFVSASVPPDTHDPASGELRWDDLLASLGLERLRPQETIRFTTIFSVTGALNDAVANSADAVNVADEFGNPVLSPRRAEVRIRLRGPGAEATPTPAPASPDEPERPRSSPTPPPLTPVAPIATPDAAPTPTELGESPSPAAGVSPTASALAGDAAAPGQGPAGGADRPAALPATGAPRPPSMLAIFATLALAAGLGLLAADRGRRP